MSGWWIILLVFITGLPGFSNGEGLLPCFNERKEVSYVDKDYYCTIEISCDGIEFHPINQTAGGNFELPWCNRGVTDMGKGDESIAINYHNPNFTKMITKGNAPDEDNLYAYLFFSFPGHRCNRDYRNESVYKKIRTCLIEKHSMLQSDTKNSPEARNCFDENNQLKNGLTHTKFGKCTILKKIKEDICRKIDLYNVGIKCQEIEEETNSLVTTLAPTPSSKASTANTPSALKTTDRVGNIDNTRAPSTEKVKVDRDHTLRCFDKEKRISIGHKLNFCTIKFSCNEIEYYRTDQKVNQSFTLPWCDRNHEKTLGISDDFIAINYNNIKFTDVITKKNLSPDEDNLSAFIFFLLPANRCNRNYRQESVLSKIQACSIEKHSMLKSDKEKPAKDRTCFDQNKKLRRELSSTNFGKCTLLKQIKEDICAKMKHSYNVRDKCQNTKDGTISLSTTKTPSPNTPTSTTTHNPYVGNYVSEEQEAEYIQILEERAKKSPENTEPPPRRQEVAVELILMLLLLTVMGAFSVFVILLNGNTMDRETTLSDEVSSEEE